MALFRSAHRARVPHTTPARSVQMRSISMRSSLLRECQHQQLLRECHRYPRQLLHRRSFGKYSVSLDPFAGKNYKPTPNLGSKLAVQAVLFDYDVLAMVHDHDEEEYKEAKKAYERKTGLGEHSIRRVDDLAEHKDASVLLKNEMRSELKKRGLDSTGKPWVLQARLQDVYDKEKAMEVLGMSGAQLGFGDSVGRATAAGGRGDGALTSPLQPDNNMGDVRAKYMAKLKEKKSRAMARQEGLAGADGGAGAEMFGEKPGTQWAQNQGANETLRYLAARGMRAGLVMPAKSEKQVSAETLQHFQDGFDSDFSTIVTAEQAQDALDKPNDPAPFEWAVKQLNLDPPKVLFVTAQGKHLKAAREAGLFSCYFTTKNARKPDVRPSYSVIKLSELRRVIEDLNGVSWAA